jgi:hypothetical protein
MHTTLRDPDGAYDWRAHATAWSEIKVASALAATLLLAALLLF